MVEDVSSCSAVTEVMVLMVVLLVVAGAAGTRRLKRARDEAAGNVWGVNQKDGKANSFMSELRKKAYLY